MEDRSVIQLVLEAAPNAMVVVDLDGRIVLHNTKLEDLTGYTAAELADKHVEILVPHSVGDGHRSLREGYVQDPQMRAMGAGRELFARRKDGTEVPVEIGLNPIQTPHGLVVLANVVDISARLAAEEGTRRSREQVELLSRVSLLGEMTASLAHELNQPL